MLFFKVSRSSNPFCWVLLGFLSTHLLLNGDTFASASTVPCTESSECESILRKGSQCVEGVCTNPFYHGGCLKSLLPDWNKTRVCNSEDPPEAMELGYCRPSPMDYMEVRFAGRNWETNNFGAFVLQIILSEMLDVPTSIEGTSPDVVLNIYDPKSRFDLGSVAFDQHYTQFIVSDRVKDCRTVTTQVEDPNDYEPCFHVDQEIWHDMWVNDPALFQHIEPIRDLGALGESALYVTKFAAVKDPTLTSYLGLAGDENRRKLADTFPRPTRWGDYCAELSPTKCEEPDKVAARPPADELEEMLFFLDGVYTGHFRKTDKNDCDKNPTTCSGFFCNSPCDWTSYVVPQSYHMKIGLSSDGPHANGGYPYLEQVDIFSAANATKTPLLINFFQSDALYDYYIGTDMEFARVLFPPPTQECADNRIDFRYQCDHNATIEQLTGSPLGICDTYPSSLLKGIGNSLRDITQNPDVPEAFWSPAYDVVLNHRLTNLQLGELNKFWLNRGTDTYNFDPRDAACRWVTENMDIVTGFIPESYPRVVQELNSFSALSKGAIGVAVFAVALVGVAAVLTFLKRKTSVMYFVQTEIFSLLLFGMFLGAVAALLMAVPPSDAVCTAASWFFNLGYVLQTVPLVSKITAIHKLATTGKRMQRVRLERWRLFVYVVVVGTLVLTFMLIWTVTDAPRKVYQYHIHGATTENGETIVEARDYCGSEFEYWYIISAVWQGLVLLPGCMIGFLASKVRDDLNDTKPMAFLLFFWLLVLILQVATYFSLFESNPIQLMGYFSLILSLDTIITLIIHVFPKFLRSGEEVEEDPLPDVFVNTTVALMDVTGFTAWASVREPVAVFQFLEQLYAGFDKLAEQHAVYKVETVGEIYVAATGIPHNQADHAGIMAKFALSCVSKMPKLVKRMEVQFGPDTGDLELRVGLHSGPVTGGFLKGKGARFQLFGDTVNTATLLQTTSKSGRIHMSLATAELLRHSGKGKWVVSREDVVNTLEKGAIQTFWLVKGRHGQDPDLSHVGSLSADQSEGEDDEDGDDFANLECQERWIEWNVSVFTTLLKQIVARRECASNITGYNRTNTNLSSSTTTNSTVSHTAGDSAMPLLEVKEIIELPKFDKKAAKQQTGAHSKVQLPKKVVEELKDYVRSVADLYKPNPFHSFAHASYVVMAVMKYMNRIVAAREVSLGENDERNRSKILHDHTYGITSDPLTQFACLYSALIHDVDHPGVPNTQLIKENKYLAEHYHERSVAEQKSLDLSWDLLMEVRFSELRSTICANAEELARFRQLVVNSVMATDLGDTELKALRNARWEKAFSKDETTFSDATSSTAFSVTAPESAKETYKETPQDNINRKATIVIEHLIQAADVAHMSQHWQIYRKWNERLFREMYKAYREGRSTTNPANTWYKGEIGFFDYYVIPLSRKLKDCGVFGPTSDENLNYAQNNRNMWEKEGEAIVREMLGRIEAEYEQETPSPGVVGLADRMTEPGVFVPPPVIFEC